MALLIALPLWCGQAAPAIAQSLKGELFVTTENGYARLDFRFAEEIAAEVRIANNILTVTFPRPVEISIRRILSGASGYVSAARRDPDGKGIRMALARKVTMNTMTAGERLFVDLLPETWTGLAPGLPRDVIDELARRAREAERRNRQQRAVAQHSKSALIRVKAITQPTFTRYVFDLPELTSVSADNSRDKLTLNFDAMLRFDLADARATLPPVIDSIESDLENEAVLVRFNFNARVDVRTFREDNSFVVDVEAERKQVRQEGTIRSDELSPMAVELTERPDAPAANEGDPKAAPAQKDDRHRRRSPATRAATAAWATAGCRPRAIVQHRHPRRHHPRRRRARGGSAACSEQPAQGRPAPQVRAEPVTPPPTVPSQSAPVPQATPSGAKQAMEPSPSAPVRVPQTAPATPPREAAVQEAKPESASDVVRVAVRRNDDQLQIVFPFAGATPAAVFRRADTVWMVFDTEATVAITALNAELGKTLRGATTTRVDAVALVRVKLERPQLISVVADGNAWVVTFANEVVEPTRPLQITRNVAASARSSVSIAIDRPRKLHRLDDPDVGDTLYVVTAAAPTRGLLKSQDFVEFRCRRRMASRCSRWPTISIPNCRPTRLS
jgi:hypothetical protein